MLPDPSSLILAALLSSAQPTPPTAWPMFRFASAAPPPATALTREAGLRPLRHPVAKKATAAVAGGIMGFFAGILVGAGIGSLVDKEYGALQGMAIGAPIGAAGGSLLALRWAR